MKKPNTLYCKDCGKAFVFSVKDQNFFKGNDYPPPVRCPHCRLVHKKRFGGKFAGLGTMLEKLGNTGPRKDYGIYGIWYCSTGFR